MTFNWGGIGPNTHLEWDPWDTEFYLNLPEVVLKIECF